jgi:IclR family transcriptional regulator, KDG regulon repressor
MTISITQSLAHGLAVLLLYDAASPSFTVAEVSNLLGYSLSKAYRIIRTLVRNGFLQEGPGKAQYTLGLNILKLGLLAQQNLNVAVTARPLMKDLALLARETVLLTAVDGTRAVCIERVESEEPIRYSLFQPGASLPLHAGASSKILMAYLPESEWDRIIGKEGLKGYTDTTLTSPEELKANLREIRKRGFALSDHEVDRDVRAVAAPIFNSVGGVVAGLSITGPIYRINKRRLGELAKLAVDYAGRISAKIGYRA